MARTRRGRWLKLAKRTDGVTGPVPAKPAAGPRTFEFGSAVVELPKTRTVVCHAVSVEDLEFWRERFMATRKRAVSDAEIMRGTLLAFRKFFASGDGKRTGNCIVREGQVYGEVKGGD